MRIQLATALRALDRWFLVPLLYLAIIAGAEILAALPNPRRGLILHCLLLLALLWHASWAARGERRALLVCLAFGPLIRIVSAWLSFPELPLVFRYLLISLPLFAAVYVARRRLGYSWSALGLTLRAPLIQAAVGLSGAILGPLQYLILRPPPLAPGLAPAQAWLLPLIALTLTALLDELIFRGLVLRAGLDSLGRWGTWYSALLFATLQLGYHSPAQFVFALTWGVFSAWVVQRTRSLIGVALAHGLANVLAFWLLPHLLGL